MACPARGAPVLVVDDDPLVRTVFAEVLGAAGFDTCVAASGRAALDLIATERVGLVLLDWDLPVLGGGDTLRAIRADPDTAALPVVVVTTDGRVEDRVAGLDAGADDYLAKPVDVEELIARVRAHVRAAAAWARVIDGHVQQREAVSTALRQATFARARETIGGVICREVADLPETGGAALFAFPWGGDDATVTLAAHGPAITGLQAGSRLPQSVAQPLMAKAAEGPWLDVRGGLLSTGPRTPVGVRSDHGAAYAPLHGPDDLHGLLVVAAERERPEGALPSLSSCLATGIDFAALGDALLSPLLAQQERRTVRRTGLVDVIADGAFSPVFQPIVQLAEVGPDGSVGDRAVVGHELLTRFRDGSAADRRFREAVALGLGSRLEHATLAAGLRHGPSGAPDRFLSVNVSPDFLVQRTGVDLIRAVRGSALVLELTEHDRVDDYGVLQQALRELGPDVRLSVDDAGAGYACLTHVLELRPAFVKLDRTWIAGIDGDPTRQALVAGLCHFSRETGCQLIAEGIERPEEVVTLRRLGVELGQGFLLGPPSADV